MDVACPFDNRLQAFQEAPGESRRRSTPPLQRHLLRRFQRVSVEAIILGCLGSWDPANDRVARRLCSKNYLRSMKRLCVSDTIAASTDIYRHHIGLLTPVAPPTPLSPVAPPTPLLSGGDGSPGDSDHLQQASGSSTSSTATGPLPREVPSTPSRKVPGT
ncbi:hypothetical protein MTO96_043014 [Rhipicephalus appendiculatus]